MGQVDAPQSPEGQDEANGDVVYVPTGAVLSSGSGGGYQSCCIGLGGGVAVGGGGGR